jgi:lysophospholipase L1-like esterase
MQRKRLIVCIVLLLASLLANVFLLSRLRARYENQLMQQVWPTGMASPQLSPGDPIQSTNVILLVGDSRMAQWGLPKFNGRVVNAGQAGATTAQVQLRVPALLDEFHPTTVVIQAGINDLKLIGLKPELEPALIAGAANNLSNVVALCSERHCRVLLLETWPVGKPELARRFVWNEKIPESVTKLNAKIRALQSPANGVLVVDLFKSAAFSPDSRSFRDALHFDPSVYERLTAALGKIVETDGSQP